MGTNSEVARILYEIADLLDLQGERFKPEAYRRAARSIESLPEDLTKYRDRGELGQIPGVGEAIEEKVREFLTTGTISYYERVRDSIPPGILTLLRAPGLGPKTIRRFLVELKITSPEELTDAIDAGRLTGVKGFGATKITQFRKAAEAARAAAGKPESRIPIRDAWGIARDLIDQLKESGAVDQIAVAGSFRRRRETVGDLDILATSRAPEKIFDRFSSLPAVGSVVLRGGTKETVRLSTGLQVDLRVVEPESFGAALQYFTGSKDHNIRLRSLARDHGLKINEYGVFEGDRRVAGTTEAEVYATLSLPEIPAEIREDQGEIDAAARGALPRLVQESDLKGDLHLHPSPTANARQLSQLLSAATRRGWEYLGVVVARVGKSGREELLSQATRTTLEGLRKRPKSRPVLLRAEEVEVRDGTLQAPSPDVDFSIAIPATSTDPAPAGRLPAAAPLLAGHLATLAGPSAGVAERLRSWVAWAKGNRVALEVTSRPGFDGLDSTAARIARDAGVELHLCAGASVAEDWDALELAVGTLRRAWGIPSEVLNRRSVAELVAASYPIRTPTGPKGRTNGRRRS